MMELAATLKTAAAVVTSVGVIGGGAFVLDERHALRTELNSHAGEFVAYRAGGRVNTILELVEQAHHEGAAEWICRTIEAEFVALCTELPDHYWCTEPDAKRELKAKAGCQ